VDYLVKQGGNAGTSRPLEGWRSFFNGKKSSNGPTLYTIYEGLAGFNEKSLKGLC